MGSLGNQRCQRRSWNGAYFDCSCTSPLAERVIALYHIISKLDVRSMLWLGYGQLTENVNTEVKSGQMMFQFCGVNAAARYVTKTIKILFFTDWSRILSTRLKSLIMGLAIKLLCFYVLLKCISKVGGSIDFLSHHNETEIGFEINVSSRIGLIARKFGTHIPYLSKTLVYDQKPS